MQREEMEPYWMQWILCSMIECSGFHAASLNAEESMHCGAMDHDCMQWSPFSEALCIPIECRWFYAAWPKSSRLNAVDSMQQDWMKWTLCSMSKASNWMQWIPCSVVKCIAIECSVFQEAWVNAVDSLQPGKMHPDWMHWIPCSWIECSRFHAAW